MSKHAPSADLAQSERRQSRRRFLTTFAVGAGLAPVISFSRDLSARRRAASLCYSAKRVLAASDFTYLGAMRLPPELSGFSYGAMAARKVNGRLQFFMTGENSANAVGNWGSLDCVWEFADTQSYHLNYTQAARATSLTKWGDIFQGKRTSWMPDGQQINMQYMAPGGLLFKSNPDRLYWAYYDGYNVSGRNDWCLGMTELRGAPANMVAYGPWRPNIGVKHGCGWLVEMPDGSLGVGAPLTSGNVGSSWGPELAAGCPFPTSATPAGFGRPDLIFPQTYVRYAFPGGSITSNGSVAPGRTIPSLRRPGNYVWHNPSPAVPVEVDPQRNAGVGTWTDLDYVTSCVYIDLPDKHGILFAGEIASGHVWYGPVDNCGHGLGNPCGGGTGPNSTSGEPRWWIYDPDQCQRVATGHLAANLTPAAEFNPATAIHDIQLGCKKALGATYFDRETRKFYVTGYQADDSIPGLQLPMLHVYQVA